MRRFKLMPSIPTLIFSVTIATTSVIVAGNMSPEEFANLEQMTMDLLGKMTPEEQEAVLREAEAMDKYINSLPPEERMRLEQELENELKGVMDSGLLQDLVTTPEPKPNISQPAKPEKSKEPVKEQLAPKEQLAEIQQIAKKIALNIGDLVAKTESSARVSQNSRLEALWLEKKLELLELQSYALVIANNNKVATALLSDDFKLLKNQIVKFRDNLKREIELIDTIDTMGSKDSRNSKVAGDSVLMSLNLDSALNFVIKELDNEQIMWNTKRLIQKHAPEEVKVTQAPAKQVIDLGPGKVLTTEKSKEAPRVAQPNYNTRSGYPMPSYGSIGSASDRSKPTAAPAAKQPEKSGGAGPARSGGSSGRAGGTSESDKDKSDKSPKESDSSESQGGKPGDNIRRRSFRKVDYTADLKQLKEDLAKDIKKIKSEIKSSKIKNNIEDYALKLAANDIAGATEQLAAISLSIDKLDALTLSPTRIAQKIDQIVSKLPKETQKKELEDLKSVFKSKHFPELLTSTARLTSDPRIRQLLAVEEEGSPLLLRSAEVSTKAQNLTKNINEIKKTLKGKPQK